MKHSARNYWLDLILFITFLLTSFTGLLLWLLMQPQTTLAFSGHYKNFWLTSHICCGMVSVAGTFIHVISHKEWLKALRGRSISSLPLKLKANRILDRILWISFLAASSFAILGLVFPGGYRASSQSRLHVAFGMFLLVGIIVHLVFHRKWIVSTIKRLHLNQAGSMENIYTGIVKE